MKIFWIILIMSNGTKNHGTVTEMSPRFETQTQCEQTMKGINMAFEVEPEGWGHKSFKARCVRIGGASE